MEILLVRHGRPAPLGKWLISGHELGDVLAGYNEAGLADVVPPVAVQKLMKSAGCVVASDLVVAIHMMPKRKMPNTPMSTPCVTNAESIRLPTHNVNRNTMANDDTIASM